MKKLLGLSIVVGGVTFAIIVGNRMSSDAMAVIIGVVFGVAASIPTSLLIVAATRGSRRREEPRMSPDPRPQIYVMPQYPWPQQQLPPQIEGPRVTGGGQFQLLEGYGDEQETVYANSGW